MPFNFGQLCHDFSLHTIRVAVRTYVCQKNGYVCVLVRVVHRALSVARNMCNAPIPRQASVPRRYEQHKQQQPPRITFFTLFHGAVCICVRLCEQRCVYSVFSSMYCAFLLPLSQFSHFQTLTPHFPSPTVRDVHIYWDITEPLLFYLLHSGAHASSHEKT